MSNGHGGGGGSGAKAVTGGAKKVIAFTLAIFVVMAIAPNVDSLMSTAEAFGGAVAGIFGAIGNVLNEITAAFQSASGQ